MTRNGGDAPANDRRALTDLDPALVTPGWGSVIRAKLSGPWKFVKLVLLVLAVAILPREIQSMFPLRRRSTR